MATHSSTLAWKIPWMEEPPWGCKELDTTERLHFTSLPQHHLGSSEKTTILKITCTPMFIAAIFTTAKAHGSNLDVHQQMNG